MPMITSNDMKWVAELLGKPVGIARRYMTKRVASQAMYDNDLVLVEEGRSSKQM